jgi:hypothetical protein
MKKHLLVATLLAVGFQSAAMAAPQSRVAIHRYVNGSNMHFYTTNFGELGAGRAGWRYEGTAGYLNTTSDGEYNTPVTPLYRYRNDRTADHLYTTAWSELGGANFGGWVYEGIIGYCPLRDSGTYAWNPKYGTTPLYRYFTGRAGHFYTVSPYEAMPIGSSEGITCYPYKAQSND